MVVLALGGGGSYLTGPLSSHATTNAEVVRRFTGRAVSTRDAANGCVLVEVGARRAVR
jgi:RNA 3'-terminal phosphate cyclase